MKEVTEMKNNNTVNICDATKVVLDLIQRSWDDVVSVTFIYTPSSSTNNNNDDTKSYNMKRLNIQLYGHGLVIVPDIKDTITYYMYSTKTEADRRHIAIDLTQARGYSNIQVAKMMKCSPSTVNHLINNTDNK